MACFLVHDHALPHSLIAEIADRAAVLRLRGIEPVLAAVVFATWVCPVTHETQVVLQPEHIQSWPSQPERPDALHPHDAALLRWMDALHASDMLNCVLLRLAVQRNNTPPVPDSEMLIFSRATLVHPELQ